MRCKRCYGTKKVMGLGWMETECANCDGTGSERPTAKLSDTDAAGETHRADNTLSGLEYVSGTAEPLESASVDVPRVTTRADRREARRG